MEYGWIILPRIEKKLIPCYRSLCEMNIRSISGFELALESFLGWESVSHADAFFGENNFSFKGKVAWDFLSEVISSKVPNCSLIRDRKAVDLNLRRYSTFNVLPRYGQLQQIWVMHHGPLPRMKHFIKTLWQSGLCATAQNLVMRYGP
jgi:hypothetical protein